MSLSRRIWISLSIGSLTLGAGWWAVAQDARIAKQPAQRAKAAASPQPLSTTMPQLLADWEAQSKKLTTLELDIYRVDKDPQWGDEEHYYGHAAFKSPQLAFLDFRKVKMQERVDSKDKRKKVQVPLKKDNKIISVAFETLVCTGQEVWQYRYDVKKVFVFPLDKDQRKRALEEGPLPFLFDMKAADAQQRYEMTLSGEDANYYLVRVRPRLLQDQESFSTAWIYLEKKYLLPKRIHLIAPNGKMTKVFDLSQIKANQPVNPRYFQGVDPGIGFKIERNPGGEAPANTAKGRLRQQNAQAARQKAARAVDDPPRQQ